MLRSSMLKQRQRGLQDGVDDASSDKSELALLMRENAEALFLDLAGGAYSRAFNPGCPPKRRQRSHTIQGLREHHGHPAKDVDQRKDAKMGLESRGRKLETGQRESQRAVGKTD